MEKYAEIPHIDKEFAESISPVIEEILKLFPHQKAVFATSPNRFNDIYWYSWNYIKIDDAEYDADFGDDKPIRDLKNSNDIIEKNIYHIFSMLSDINWRSLFAHSVDFPWDDEVLSIQIKNSVVYLTFSTSNNTDRYHIFKYDPIEVNFEYIHEYPDIDIALDDSFFDTNYLTQNP